MKRINRFLCVGVAVIAIFFACAPSASGQTTWVTLGDGKPVKTTPVKRSFPQVDVPAKYRVANFADRPNDGNCLWVSIDTLLQAGGHDVSLSKYRWGAYTPGHEATPAGAVRELNKRNVPVIYKAPFTAKDTTVLQRACDEGCGAVVTVDDGPTRHAITLVGIDSERVAVIDSNDPAKSVQTLTMKRFLQRWDGGAIVIPPKGYEGELVKQCSGGNCPAPAPGFGGSNGPFATPRGSAPFMPESDTGSFQKRRLE